MTNNIEKNSIVQGEITGYTAEGAGVARINGMAIFVKNGARGDIAKLRITKVLTNYAFAVIEEILTPSPHRIPSQCPHFPKCGGCDFHHISYAEELSLKTKRVSDALSRIGGFDVTVPACIPSPSVAGYRNKCQFPVGQNDDGSYFGFYRMRSHQIVPITHCLIQDDRANLLAQTLCKWMDENRIAAYDETLGTGLIRHVYVRTGELGAQLCIVATSIKCNRWQALVKDVLEVCSDIKSIVVNVNNQQTNRVLGDVGMNLWGTDNLKDSMLGMTFSLSPQAFYQVNHPQAEAVYKKVIDLAQLDENTDVLDLYCGTGTITIALSQHCRQAVGVELVAPAIEDAKTNASSNGIKNIRFLCNDAGVAADELLEEGFNPHVIVTDPPRKGMDSATVNSILKMRPKRIIYVSCDSASLARDAAKLREGGYGLVSVTPFDMFPRTANVECVAELVLA